MKNHHHSHRPCASCHKEVPEEQAMPMEALLPGTSEIVRREVPDWEAGKVLCRSCLAHFRARYLESLLQSDASESEEFNNDVLESMTREESLVSRLLTEENDERDPIGARIADQVARFGGSWTFIIVFALVLLAWIALNSFVLMTRAFDPFPYILLNLILSCLASIQAPVIMMSQNRLEVRDRKRAENDYRINLKAELEIRMINRKLDHLLNEQWRRLLEIQRLQVEFMERQREGK